jgi:hypothetical protein
MTNKRIKKTDMAPPQLIGVHVDAVGIGATAFRLEPDRTHFMASFSAGSQAMEIDFDLWAGQEMSDYLVGQIRDPKAKTGSFVLEYEGRRYDCHVTVDHKRSPRRIEVTWT